jgi:hypothetical protein
LKVCVQVDRTISPGIVAIALKGVAEDHLRGPFLEIMIAGEIRGNVMGHVSQDKWHNALIASVTDEELVPQATEISAYIDLSPSPEGIFALVTRASRGASTLPLGALYPLESAKAPIFYIMPLERYTETPAQDLAMLARASRQFLMTNSRSLRPSIPLLAITQESSDFFQKTLDLLEGEYRPLPHEWSELESGDYPDGVVLFGANEQALNYATTLSQRFCEAPRKRPKRTFRQWMADQMTVILARYSSTEPWLERPHVVFGLPAPTFHMVVNEQSTPRHLRHAIQHVVCCPVVEEYARKQQEQATSHHLKAPS